MTQWKANIQCFIVPQSLYFVVYGDDIVLTSSDHHGITHLFCHFQAEDLGNSNIIWRLR